MSILFTDIYKKAIALFDDPKITAAYKSNVVQFDKLMYTYLQNAIMMFNNPLAISIQLASQNLPVGTMCTFDADGINNTYTLDDDFEILDNSLYTYIEGDITVKGELNKENRTVTFPDILPEGQQYAVEQYFPGEFTGVFGKLNQYTNQGDNMVEQMVQNILARLLVKAWGEEERNMLLDIRNIMQDSDFKLTGNDKILTSKNAWINQLDSEVLQYQNRLAWMIRFMDGSRMIGRG